MFWFFKKIFGTKNQREVRRLQPIVERINAIEAEYKKLNDDQLRARTAEWKQRLAGKSPEEQKLILSEILPDAFAAVKNACRRLCGREIIVRDHPLKWDMVPFDTQLIGGMGVDQGRDGEEGTGGGQERVGT